MTADDHAAEVEALGRRYPGWTVWFGPFTAHWWALPPRGRGGGDFVEAETPQRLIALIEVIQHSAVGNPMTDDGLRPSRDPRQDGRRPSNLLRLEGVTPSPFRRVPASAWPSGTAR
ncbi:MULTISPECIES: hypothetical protein [Thermomonosporaceae]|uniref:hypothetical protein n=1 Tax=Thermomonosporaceae TaxID=2012 RepID=UPI00255AD7B5|nr:MULTISPECIES: hypothetical protein [Thermomonosporaceae]MDL4771592.1 hypothetical protein [Actinomadura xylanilytica]